jgi:hypothetical protein
MISAPRDQGNRRKESPDLFHRHREDADGTASVSARRSIRNLIRGRFPDHSREDGLHSVTMSKRRALLHRYVQQQRTQPPRNLAVAGRHFRSCIARKSPRCEHPVCALPCRTFAGRDWHFAPPPTGKRFTIACISRRTSTAKRYPDRRRVRRSRRSACSRTTGPAVHSRKF